MNEKQIEIIKSITNEMVQVYQNMLFDESTTKDVGNKYLEVAASVLSSVHMTIINGFAHDVSDNSDEHKKAMLDLSEVIIADVMNSVMNKIKKMEMH